MSGVLSLVGFRVPRDLDRAVEDWILEQQALVKRRLQKRWVGELGLRIALLVARGEVPPECVEAITKRDPRIRELLELLGVSYK